MTPVAMITNGEVPTILKVGFTGFAYLLMLLAFFLLLKFIRVGRPNPLTFWMIGAFMFVSLIMTCLATGSDLYKYHKTASIVVLVDPSEMPDSDTRLSIFPSLETAPVELASPVSPVHLSIADGESLVFKLDSLTQRVQKLEEDVRVEKRAKEIAQANVLSAAQIHASAGIGHVPF